MSEKIDVCFWVVILILSTYVFGQELYAAEKSYQISNQAYELIVTDCRTQINVRLYDKAMDSVWCDAPYYYYAQRIADSDVVCYESLESLSIDRQDGSIRIQAVLAGLELNHIFELPQDRPIMEEHITLHNSSGSLIELKYFEAGFVRQVANESGSVLPEFADDRLVAIPFRHGAGDWKGYWNDFSISDVLGHAADESRHKNSNLRFVSVDPKYHLSEGWAWIRGDHTLGMFKFNQEHVEYSVITVQQPSEGMALRFGGACMLPNWSEPSASTKVEPGRSINFGLLRYQTFDGDYNSALYGFRELLDEKGCRFPDDYNPPVHWNELYDNPEWWGVSTPGKPPETRSEARKLSYSKALIEEEAAKARDYSCESLYLDPGWDVRFGSFIWGEEWLGPCEQFVEEMESKYGLKVSLHCPLATWMSAWYASHSDRASALWPKESFRMDADGKIVENSVCLGSRQYLDLAEKRLLKLCKAGVAFLMFDGNMWNGGCWNPNHGHPVPYTTEDHIRANLDLAQRIHAKYPDVLIEMHDMLAGGSRGRPTPVYYKYGLPGSYDDNWGFELMWDPMADLKSGRALALYYYNMGCNVPAYLHIDLRGDNEHCVVLWWYASTCRHLGIGGTHPDPVIAWRQKEAMKRYRSLERFYKRGDFYGINEQVHLHVLPQENTVVVNMFNLSGERRMVEGSIPVDRLGIDPDRWYISRGRSGGGFHRGTFFVRREMAPWSTRLIVFRAP